MGMRGATCTACRRNRFEDLIPDMFLCYSVYPYLTHRSYLYPPPHFSACSDSVRPLTSTIVRTIARRPLKFRRCPLGKFISRQLLIRRRLHRIRWCDYTPLASETPLPKILHSNPCFPGRQDDSFPYSNTATLSRSPHLWHIIL